MPWSWWDLFAHKPCKFFVFAFLGLVKISALFPYLNLNNLPPPAAAASPNEREFIRDVQLLLEHNQNFYIKYGSSDHLINLKFFEARDAAEGIFNRPDLFAEKVNSLQKLINAKVATFGTTLGGDGHVKLAQSGSSLSSRA